MQIRMVSTQVSVRATVSIFFLVLVGAEAAVHRASLEEHSNALADQIYADLRGTTRDNIASRIGSTRISPALEPKSDKKFFGKDYTDDKGPAVNKYYVFDHPYPAVQDSGDFDKDFVKDENSDGGRWAAQMEYDLLRSKIRAAKEKMEQLKVKMEKEHGDYLKAKTEAESTYNDVVETNKEVAAAKRARDEAVKKVNELEGSSRADGTKTGGAVGRAIGDVQKEMDDLEKCKKALANAKEKLRKLLKQKEEEKKVQAQEAKTTEAQRKEKATSTEGDKEKSPAQKAKENGKEKNTGKGTENGTEKGTEKGTQKGKEKSEQEKEIDTEKLEKAQDKHEDAVEDVAEIHKDVAKETKEASEVQKNYLKKEEDFKRTERQLEEAAKTLKKFRRPPFVDGNGGVYNVPDSFALVHTRPNMLMMVFAVLLAGGAAEFLPRTD